MVGLRNHPTRPGTEGSKDVSRLVDGRRKMSVVTSDQADQEDSAPDKAKKGRGGTGGGIFLDAAYTVLSTEKRYMDNRELTSIAQKMGLLKDLKGKTPHHTMASALYTDVKKKIKGASTSLFIRPQEGIFGLREWAEESPKASSPSGPPSPRVALAPVNVPSGKRSPSDADSNVESRKDDALPARKRGRALAEVAYEDHEEAEDDKPARKKRGRPLGWRKYGPHLYEMTDEERVEQENRRQQDVRSSARQTPPGKQSFTDLSLPGRTVTMKSLKNVKPKYSPPQARAIREDHGSSPLSSSFNFNLLVEAAQQVQELEDEQEHQGEAVLEADMEDAEEEQGKATPVGSECCTPQFHVFDRAAAQEQEECSDSEALTATPVLFGKVVPGPESPPESDRTPKCFFQPASPSPCSVLNFSDESGSPRTAWEATKPGAHWESGPTPKTSAEKGGSTLQEADVEGMQVQEAKHGLIHPPTPERSVETCMPPLSPMSGDPAPAPAPWSFPTQIAPASLRKQWGAAAGPLPSPDMASANSAPQVWNTSTASDCDSNSCSSGGALVGGDILSGLQMPVSGDMLAKVQEAIVTLYHSGLFHFGPTGLQVPVPQDQ